MGSMIRKKRELFKRNKDEDPILNNKTICLSDITEVLTDLSQSLSKIEIQNNKTEATLAYKLSRDLEKMSVMLKERIREERINILHTK